MTLLHYVPRPPLSDFVDLLWQHQGPAPRHPRERVLPTGTVELVINLRADTVGYFDRANPRQLRGVRGPLVGGPQSEFFVIGTADQASILGVHFKPGGAFPFLKVPAGELHNTHVALETLWGAEAIRLRDRLAEAKTPAARFRILEESLLAQAARPLARHPAVAFALREFRRVPQRRTVAAVTKEVGLSPRRFIAVFAEEVGLTPKLFCRVQRFQELLRRIATEERVDWANVALACGYYDQAHFINDFQAFSGLTPTGYLRERGEHVNHVPLAE
jgi:AraC-like DNA-binding protein